MREIIIMQSSDILKLKAKHRTGVTTSDSNDQMQCEPKTESKRKRKIHHPIVMNKDPDGRSTVPEVNIKYILILRFLNFIIHFHFCRQ